MEQVTKTVSALNENGFSDISMFECLIRPHEVSTHPKPLDISHAIARLQEADVKKEERRQRQIANAIIRNAAKRKREDDLQATEGPDDVPTKRQKTETAAESDPVKQSSGASTQPESSISATMQTQVVSRVIPEVRGHTSYLTFAIKLPLRPAESQS